ncbi:hypothetical protein HY374_03320 [Candidatus Berkelbacteria bacterium]|nr:hypothetical protein [Candidatus Berkelbacteria bacterium]
MSEQLTVSRKPSKIRIHPWDRWVVGVLLTAYCVLPATASAQALLPDCFKGAESQTYETVKECLKDVGGLAIQWVLAIALIFLMITGYLYVTSLGNKQQAETAKNSFLFITIGILVVLSAYLVVNTLGAYFLK